MSIERSKPIAAGPGVTRLRDGVAPEQVLSGSGPLPGFAPAANAHIHLPPNFSAFDTMEQAVDLAAGQNVRILGASNYYDYSIYDRFAGHCLDRGVYPLFGLEIIALLPEIQASGTLINDPGNPGKMYLCGKAITKFAAPTPKAETLLCRIRRSDEERVARVTSRVAECFARGGVNIALDYGAIVDRIVRRHSVPRETVVVQERHVAQAFQEEFCERVPAVDRAGALSRILGAAYAAAPDDPVRIQNDIRAHLMKTGKPAFVEEAFISFPEAHSLVLELGGIPCYPTLADGTNPVCPFENPPEKLIATLLENRVYCAEFIPIRNTPEVLDRYVRAFRQAGFVVTAGTEHNTLDLLAIEPACIRRIPVSPELKSIFLEGACVTAAHQYLSLHGREGYVNASGALNAAFSDPEARIAHFRRIGEAVVSRQLGYLSH